MQNFASSVETTRKGIWSLCSLQSSPDAYVPCRVRHALWGNYTTTLRYKCLRHKEEEQREPPTHDEMNSRCLGFLQCLVRVNNLPERCHPEQLAMLFSQFGPLRMWHVAMCSSGA
ncbi:hypothetical protein PVAP13_2NG426500 [Panicum virgatum]|uniref:RRM domain-containing protein n=1 Tax=Panicum virgatum TaxID=38727 RepID=A0A8T0VUL4_PANVG|nr:hypothetical protein PVAP13_2NG426500 [Panicum virgatum]